VRAVEAYTCHAKCMTDSPEKYHHWINIAWREGELNL
jgi:hypothetical protein